jgi:hypothetical protein
VVGRCPPWRANDQKCCKIIPFIRTVKLLRSWFQLLSYGIIRSTKKDTAIATASTATSQYFGAPAAVMARAVQLRPTSKRHVAVADQLVDRRLTGQSQWPRL